MLQFSRRAEEALQGLHGQGGDGYLRLVKRLVALEQDAMTFEALYGVTELETRVELPLGAGPPRAHIMEAAPGVVFVIIYRLTDDAEDVWILDIARDR